MTPASPPFVLRWSAWLAAGRPGFAALLPVVVAPGAPLAFRAWTPDC